jgi:hypothetical protein
VREIVQEFSESHLAYLLIHGDTLRTAPDDTAHLARIDDAATLFQRTRAVPIGSILVAPEFASNCTQ